MSSHPANLEVKLPPPSWIAVVSVFHVTALLVTIFRVYHRFRTSRMWWDDYVVMMVFVLDVLGFINIWYAYSHDFNGFYEGRLLFNFFLTYLFQFSTVGLTRVSIALSIGRIFPKGHPARRISTALAILIVLIIVIVVTVLEETCQGGDETSWWTVTGRYCGRGPKKIMVSGIVSMTLELLCDVILIVTPLVILWRVKLPRLSRCIILVAFSGSVLNILLFIICSAVWFGPGLHPKPVTNFIIPMISQLDMAMSLIVCNFLVTTTLAYKWWRRRCGSQRQGGSTTTEADDSSDVDESSARPDDTELSSPSAMAAQSTQPRTFITFTDVMTDSELYQQTMSTPAKTELDGCNSR